MLIVGTATAVGKTWVGAHLAAELRARGHPVSARKPAQSFAPEDPPDGTDAAVLGRATGERPGDVCPAHRWYERAMAPPMAAEALGRSSFTLADLRRELRWPPPPPPSETPPPTPTPSPTSRSAAGWIGLLETAGGVRSPQALDGDAADLALLVQPDVVLLVADAGLGTINAVRSGVDALGDLAAEVVVVLNRFDGRSDLHRRNRRWLADIDRFDVLELPAGLSTLARRVAQGVR